MECFLFGERGEGWAKALDAGLSADTPLSSVNLTICGPMSETALQAFENLFFNKSLSSVSVIVEGDMWYSLAVILSRALAGETAVKSLELRVNRKLSFRCANLIERGIVKNNSLSNLVFSVCGERPDNWQAVVENLNARLAEKLTITFEINPNTFSQVTATQLTDFLPCVITDGLFEQENVTLNVWGELTVDGAETLLNLLPCPWVCHLTLNIHGKLTDDFLHCTARYVDNQKPLRPITINTWNQLTNEGEAFFKELELDTNPAVTLNVCDVHVPSDVSDDNKIESIDNPASLIALLEEVENTGKENLTVTFNVHIDDSTYGGGSLNDSLQQGFARNCTLKSLTLTINNFSARSTELSLTLIGCLEGCISLKSLILTLNEYNKWKDIYAFLLHNGLRRITSLISFSLTLNFYTTVCGEKMYFQFRDISDGGFVRNISLNSFTLTINNFSSRGNWGIQSVVPWPNYESLTTFNLTLNNCADGSGDDVLEENDKNLFYFLDEVMKVNSLRTLRLSIKDLPFLWNDLESYCHELVEKSPSLELVEISTSSYSDVGSSLGTVKWEKQ